jgi:membrane fusion protein, adhesin transport system
MAARIGSEQKLPAASRVIWLVATALALLLCWAAWAQLDEVSTGTGRIVASSKPKVVQSLEGGVLSELLVKEGDTVQPGQVLARLDPTRAESTVEESSGRLRAALAMAARLEAEVNDTPLRFPPEVREEPDLVRSETALYRSRRAALLQTLEGLHEAQRMMKDELEMNEPLLAKGAVSDVEILRLRRQLSELKSKAAEAKNQYQVKAREDLARANAEIETQRSVTRGRTDTLARTTLTSPVRGVVKEISQTTLGGVVPPNGRLMEIVPLDERLQVEVQISPRDIAYIHPGQAATVKISAYDASIYGGLQGRVAQISPDTIQDEVRRDQYYYRVYIHTERDYLEGPLGKRLPIVPGMVATVDIHTGSKTVLDYLVKPLNKAGEAMRER